MSAVTTVARSRKAPPPQAVRPYGEPPPVAIGEPQTAPTDLPAEQPILFDQTGERLSLAGDRASR